jgi:hypothetical protein
MIELLTLITMWCYNSYDTKSDVKRCQKELIKCHQESLVKKSDSQLMACFQKNTEK